jgi:glycosyltransferase involved in cell wall biosynthesis
MTSMTVAICTWNRAQLLDQTLAEMRKLRIPSGVEWELLIVNNNCTDNTDEVICRHQRTLPIRRLYEPKPGLSHARNCAAAAARGDLVLWTDDDVLVDEKWLETVADASARYPEASGFGGPIQPWFPVSLDPDRLAAFPILGVGFCGLDHGLGEEVLPPDQFIFGANMAFRRSVHETLPFQTFLGMKPRQVNVDSTTISLAVGAWEEIEFLGRIRDRGQHVIWLPSMRVKHYVDPQRMTISYLQEYMKARGRTRTLCEGIPDGKKIMGVPGWLIRACARVTAEHYYHRLLGNHREALAKKSLQCELIGTMQACFEQRHSRRGAGQLIGRATPL